VTTKDSLVPLDAVIREHKMQVALEALELAVQLWPVNGQDVPVLEPETWAHLRRFLLDVPEILGV
jgi:hypothetical protein